VGFSAGHHKDNPSPDKAATIALLRKNSAEAAKAIRALSDAELDRATLASLYAGDALPDEARFLVGRRLPTIGIEPFRWLMVNAVRNGWLMLERLGL